MLFSKGLHPTHKNSLAVNEAVTGWMFILPAVIGLSIFIYGAIIYSIGISLTDWDLFTPGKWVGLSNFKTVFRDSQFYQCLYNTLYFVVLMVPFGIMISMGMAITLNHQMRGISFFRTAFYMPSITSTIAIGMVWLWIFNPNLGILNSVLRGIGISNPPYWLESTMWAKPALIIMRLWQLCGYYMIMFLSGLQSIPVELYESADIDGASFWQKTRYITIPMLSNITFFVAIMLVIDSFSIFDAIYIMTAGSPGGSTNTMLYYIYTEAFKSYRMGYASSLAWVLFVIIFVFTVVQFAVRRKTEQTNA